MCDVDNRDEYGFERDTPELEKLGGYPWAI